MESSVANQHKSLLILLENVIQQLNCYCITGHRSFLLQFTYRNIVSTLRFSPRVMTNLAHLCFLCSDLTQLKQLHNQVLLEQQQVHQTSSRDLSFNTTLLNSATSLNQQSTSTTYKQSKASVSQAFSYTRPKQFLPPQTTPPIISSSSSSVTIFSSVSQGIQRTNSRENVTGNPPPVQSRSSGGFTGRSEQSSPSPKESTVPLTLSTSSVKQFQPQSVTPAPVSPTGWIQNPVAFLSAVLPSLPSLPSTNAMGLPRSTPVT